MKDSFSFYFISPRSSVVISHPVRRGGFFRNVPQQNWVPRTFGLTHKGKLLYYEAATIQEAAASASGLGMPRQHLDLSKEGCTWATPSNETDGHTKYMVRGGGVCP